jgi:phage shock protein A
MLEGCSDSYITWIHSQTAYNQVTAQNKELMTRLDEMQVQTVKFQHRVKEAHALKEEVEKLKRDLKTVTGTLEETVTSIRRSAPGLSSVFQLFLLYSPFLMMVD